VLALSGTLGAFLFAAALAAPDYRTTFIFTGAGAFACSATAPCLFSIVSGRFPRIRSQLYGYMEASIAAAAILGSFLVGFLSDLGVPLSAAMGLSPLAALTLGVIAMVWKIKRPFGGEGCRRENCGQV
jgi:MFS family permease